MEMGLLVKVASISSAGIILMVVAMVPLMASFKKVASFDAFVEGAKGSLDVAYHLVPYLVGMIVVVGMLRDSGAIDLLSFLIKDILAWFYFPEELFPLCVLRPFSGAASNAIMFDLIKEYGPDSLIAQTAATIMGSTETTFYIASVYFGAVGVKQTRHAIGSSLIGELAGIIVAIIGCRWILG